MSAHTFHIQNMTSPQATFYKNASPMLCTLESHSNRVLDAVEAIERRDTVHMSVFRGMETMDGPEVDRILTGMLKFETSRPTSHAY